MRLLLISQDFPPDVGGIETYTAELAPRLAKRCSRFLLVAPARPQDERVDRTLDYEVHRLPVRPDLLVLRAIPHLLRLNRRESFDVAFHVQWPTTFASLIARQLTGTPTKIATSLHGRDAVFAPSNLPLLNRGYRFLRRKALAGSDRVLPVSHFLADRATELGVAPARLSVIANGTNPDRFYPEPVPELRRKLGLADRRVVLSAGRLVPKKGFATTLRALHHVVRDVPEILLLIIGDGSERERLKQLATRLDLNEHVRFLGPVPHEQLRRYYNLAEVFVMPGHEEPDDVEGFGIVYLEANACEVPTIGARAGGVPDAVAHEETGLLVPPRDPAATAAALRQLLKHPDRARRLGQQGRQRVLDRLNWDAVAERVYHTLAHL